MYETINLISAQNCGTQEFKYILFTSRKIILYKKMLKESYLENDYVLHIPKFINNYGHYSPPKNLGQLTVTIC